MKKIIILAMILVGATGCSNVSSVETQTVYESNTSPNVEVKTIDVKPIDVKPIEIKTID